jgi:isopentenyl diphosphate isomerase/L-lactate dehydrogenase-like FMN-dependent dehydrogenase
MSSPATGDSSMKHEAVAAGTVSATPAGTTGAAMGGSAPAANRTVAQIDVNKEFPVVRALYVNRFAAQSSKRMKQLIQIADETEINAFVIDLKDEFGLNYVPSNKEFARNAARPQDPADRAHGCVQGFGDGGRAPGVDDPSSGWLALA